MNLNPGDACSSCWHLPNIQQEDGGIGNFNIGKLIETRGGVLDQNYICNYCHFNYILATQCTHCKYGNPCSTHCTTVYNGSQNKQMPRVIHLLYMRNSPYKRDWDDRPKSIGKWYALQCQSYSEAVHILKRFVRPEIHYHLWYLNTEKPHEFWQGLHNILNTYFSNLDSISQAVHSFYITLYNKLG
jgi:hypothetical protein